MIVKVCGMRETGNIRQVEQTGADWMGFIFYPRSARFVAELPAYLPQRQKRVGVFVNADPSDLHRIKDQYRLHLVQLHGTESPERCAAMRRAGVQVIKAFSPKQADDLAATAAYEGTADYFLFDTPTAGFGGSGQSFDWTLLQHYTGQTPFLLSGGIRPDSLKALARFRHPHWAGIDLNSGFELAPGVKDARRLQRFIEDFKNIHK